IAFVVVGVLERPVGLKTVSLTDLVCARLGARGETVAVGVVRVALGWVGRAMVVGCQELVDVVIGEVGGPVGAHHLGDVAGGVEGVLVGGDRRTAVAVDQVGQAVEAVIRVRGAGHLLRPAQVGEAVNRRELAYLVVGDVHALVGDTGAALGDLGHAVQG